MSHRPRRARSSLWIPLLPLTLLALAGAPDPAGAAAPATATADTVDPTSWGPYGVGVAKLVFNDPARGGREIVTEVWYPARVDADAPGEYYYHLGYGQATRDATPITDETFPLVAFSHGNGGTRVQSIFYCEHLASQGYVVAAPDHLGNTFYGYDDALTAKAPIDRPLDITYMIDQLLLMNAAGEGPVPGTLDADKIAITGHSFGGFTSLVISGAWLDLDTARADCERGDDLACGAAEYAEALYGPGLQWLDLSDPRVSVSIPQTPGIYGYFGDEGLSHVFTATAEMASRQDDLLPYDEEALPIYLGLPTDKYLLTLEFRGHYAYSSAWDVRPFGRRCESYEDCSDRDPSHTIVNTLATAFLGYHLKGEAVWEPWLQADYYRRNWPVTASFESDVRP